MTAAPLPRPPLPSLLRHWAGRGLAEAWPLARDSGLGWYRDGAPSMGAALAFFTLFSMAPLLLLVIAIAGLAIGDDTARELLFAQLADLLGTKGAEAVQGVLAAADDRTEGVIAATLSFAALVVGAGGVFAELRRDLDRIWRFEAPPWRGVWNALQRGDHRGRRPRGRRLAGLDPGAARDRVHRLLRGDHRSLRDDLQDHP